MQKAVLMVRWLVGLLFIFSGLIKANDPLGLSYKMQEFFEAWQLKGFHNFTLPAAVGMNILEVVAGVAIIVGWQFKRFVWLLLLLIAFFTFLTAYVLFSGKIHACGCFGDCVPLTPIQTFTKDILLLVLSLFLLWQKDSATSLLSNKKSMYVVVISFLLTIGLQWFVLLYLPLKDCLPYAEGKNITQGMQLPPDAKSDVFAMVFKYKKDGKEVEFKDSIPEAVVEDSTYTFVDRYDKLIEKGTGLPAITDFVLTTQFSNDTTQALLNSKQPYVLLMVKDFDNVQQWKNGNLGLVADELAKKKIPLFIVTPKPAEAVQHFTKLPILTCDATVIKTAARVNPTYIFMQGDRVAKKLSYKSEGKLIQFSQQLPALP